MWIRTDKGQMINPDHVSRVTITRNVNTGDTLCFRLVDGMVVERVKKVDLVDFENNLNAMVGELNRRGFIKLLSAFGLCTFPVDTEKMVGLGICHKWIMTIDDEMVWTDCIDETTDYDRRMGLDIALSFKAYAIDLHRQYPHLWRQIDDDSLHDVEPILKSTDRGKEFYFQTTKPCKVSKLFRYGKLFRVYDDTEYPKLLKSRAGWEHEIRVNWRIIDENESFEEAQPEMAEIYNEVNSTFSYCQHNMWIKYTY